MAYVEWLADENQKEELMTFANDAKKWAENKDVFKRTYGEGDQASVLQNVEVDSAWTNYAHAKKATEVSTDETKGTTTFTSLNTGYYLVYPEGGSTGVAGETQGVYTEDARGTDAMLINIPTNETSTTWNIKSTYPTVDKEVTTTPEGDAADNGSAQVGDEVTFTLTAKVPDMSDFDTYYFAFIDTLSEGLDLSIASDTFAETDVTVYIYDADAGEQADDNHKVSVDAFNASYVTNPSKTLKVEFADLKNVQVNNANVEAGDTIQVVYKATINKEAVTGQDESFGNAENSVKLEYSNNPSDDGHGESTPDISKVYTYDIDVNKFATDVSNLAGAEFVLSISATAPTEDQIKANYAEYDGLIKLVGSGESYRVAKPGEEGAVNSFTTTANGDINIAGLEAGTYYLHEVKAPDGYNRLKAPVKIEIVVTEDDYENATIKVNSQDVNDEDGNNFIVNVENKQGIELPETGSIGTIGLTVAGVVIVAIGLFAMPRKKKDQD